jgi:hypothetical protein
MARHPSEMQSSGTRHAVPPAHENDSEVLVAPAQTVRERYGIVPARPQKLKVPLGSGPGLGAAGAGNFPDFIYRGGPIIANPQVHLVFLGNWTSAASQTRATDLQQFVGDLLNSNYMNMLAQYGVGSSGAMAGAVFIAEANANITDGDLQTALQTAITNGTAPEPTPGSSVCFIIYLDDNIVITDEQICVQAFGYHSHFQTTAGNPCYYGIVAGLTNNCLTSACSDDTTCNLHLAETQEQRQTSVTSHELSEMITNPNVALSRTDTRTESWCRPLNAINVSPHEAGDICSSPQGAATITVGPRTWTVQLMYSKWDDMNSNGATTCVTGSAFPLPSLLPACTLVLDRSTFGRDEISSFGAVANFPDALYVVLDGYTPDELGLTASNLDSPPTFWSFGGTFPALSASGVTIALDTTTGVQLEDASNLQVIQRITAPFNITFTGTGAFSGIPANPGFQDFTITATVTTNGVLPNPNFSRTSETAEIELVLQADPFMSAGETWWLSNDMRVFTVTPATLPSTNIPLQYSTTAYTSDPNTYIKALINELNTNFTDPTITNTPFNAITADEDQSALQPAQQDSNGNAVFNFGLARVHLKGDTAMNVRTFFRLFIAPSPDTTYDQSTTYRELPQTDGSGNVIPGTLIPVIGFRSNDMASTLPFFAEPRVVPTTDSTTRQPDSSNVQTIPSPLAPTPPAGAEVYAYFGCYLDVNQPTPQFPLNPATASTPNGPWQTSELLPIPAIIMGSHACLVAEIAYDPDPIPSGASPATSDKLGQRNLSWVGADNPGGLAAHRVPALFDLAPTTALRKEQMPPDELMIDWGNTPAGAPAAIYLPQAKADDILDLARRLYARPQLTKLDAHTIRCSTGGVTYVPIPASSGANFSGLITVDLPSTVRTGQQFRIVVKRITSRLETPVVGDVQRAFNWRYVAGAFQINIPVSTGSELLGPEENLLAVFKWKLEQIPPTNRWYPTLQRFIDQVSGRVEGFGGNPQTVPPSQTGFPQPITKPGPGGVPPGDLEYVGKVSGLVYDRFGDFEGFTLETEGGNGDVFHSDETAIEELVRRAWLERWVVAVIVRKSERHVPVSIVMRRAPRR